MRGHARAVAASALAVLAASAVAGCGASPGKPAGSGSGTTTASAPATKCGMVRTAAGVPVDVEVSGRAACAEAMTVERDYTRALASGKVPGNGGGAPVHIHGWVCQGYDTPQVLSTGRASACRKQGMRILAILPSPSAPPSS